MSTYWCGEIVFHPCAQNSLLMCAALIHLHNGGMAIKIQSKYGKLFSRALIVNARINGAPILFRNFMQLCLPPAFDTDR